MSHGFGFLLVLYADDGKPKLEPLRWPFGWLSNYNYFTALLPRVLSKRDGNIYATLFESDISKQVSWWKLSNMLLLWEACFVWPLSRYGCNILLLECVNAQSLFAFQKHEMPPSPRPQRTFSCVTLWYGLHKRFSSAHTCDAYFLDNLDGLFMHPAIWIVELTVHVRVFKFPSFQSSSPTPYMGTLHYQMHILWVHLSIPGVSSRFIKARSMISDSDHRLVSMKNTDSSSKCARRVTP